MEVFIYKGVRNSRRVSYPLAIKLEGKSISLGYIIPFFCLLCYSHALTGFIYYSLHKYLLFPHYYPIMLYKNTFRNTFIKSRISVILYVAWLKFLYSLPMSVTVCLRSYFLAMKIPFQLQLMMADKEECVCTPLPMLVFDIHDFSLENRIRKQDGFGYTLVFSFQMWRWD